MSGENGIPADLLKQLGGVPTHAITPFEKKLLTNIASVTMALHALTVQMEAGRMQRTASGTADVEATAKYAQDVATAALQMAGIKISPRAEAKEAGG